MFWVPKAYRNDGVSFRLGTADAKSGMTVSHSRRTRMSCSVRYRNVGDFVLIRETLPVTDGRPAKKPGSL